MYNMVTSGGAKEGRAGLKLGQVTQLVKSRCWQRSSVAEYVPVRFSD